MFHPLSLIRDSIMLLRRFGIYTIFVALLLLAFGIGTTIESGLGIIAIALLVNSLIVGAFGIAIYLEGTRRDDVL